MLREKPVLALDQLGSVMSGMFDLIVETPAGLWEIDHKSDQGDDTVQAFAVCRARFESYATVLAKRGNVVLGMAINWVRRGEVMLERLDGR